MSDSVVLSMLPLNPSNIENLDFSKPTNNGIRIISPDYLISSGKVYYGDEIDLDFWDMLHISFGSTKVKIVCIGDSLTAGYPYTTNKPDKGNDLYSWTYTLRSLSGNDIINKGVSGETSSEMLARFNTDVIALSPDYCIIECGTNDANLTNPSNIPLSTCLQNIQDMVDLCIANNITPIFAHYSEQVSQLMAYGMSSSDANYLHDYVEDVKLFEQSLGYIFLDFTSTVVNSSGVNTLLFSDFIHPNSSGYQIWGRYANSQLYKLSKNTNPLTRVDGYRYVYDYNKRKFYVYDNTGTNILTINNISSITDLNIDFTIHKSHQFEIIAGSPEFGFQFILPAILKKEEIYSIEQDCLLVGVDNICTVYDNSHLDIRYIGNIFNKRYETYVEEFYYGLINYYKDIYYLFPEVGINFDKLMPLNCFYLGSFRAEKSVLLKQTLSAMYFKYNLLLASLSVNMYPDLMPIIRDDESQANRPVYEPWLILGLVQFLSHKTEDFVDSYPIPVFDLQPWWS